VSISAVSLFLLPAGLGLLGFIEPCTIGGHLLFLDTQKDRTCLQKQRAVAVFVVVRALVASLFGGTIAFLGNKLISVQTGIWLMFGLIYFTIGVVFLFGRGTMVKKKIDFAPPKWKTAKSPALLGIAFGLNIPACAAPILFGLLGLAATTRTVLAGFTMMFVFGLFLSLPLALFAFVPSLANTLDKLGHKVKQVHWIIGLIFVALGLWSIWFGLYVDPANWVGK
jgi:cytochrome c-type biogenesis protein